MFAKVNVDSAGDECKVLCETSNKGGSFNGPEVAFTKQSCCAALAATVVAAADVMDDSLFLLDLFPPPAVASS